MKTIEDITKDIQIENLQIRLETTQKQNKQLQAKLEKAVEALEAIDNHLDYDVHSIIAHGSNLHNKLKQALKEIKEL